MKKLIFSIFTILLILTISACGSETKKEHSDKKKENELLKESKDPKADKFAKEFLNDVRELNDPKMSKKMTDSAIKNMCNAQRYSGDLNECGREFMEKETKEFEPEGELKTLVAQYDKNQVSYVAIHEDGEIQYADTDLFSKLNLESNEYLEMFVVGKEDNQYKVKMYHGWFETDKTYKKFLDKENVYVLEGNYSDIFGE